MSRQVLRRLIHSAWAILVAMIFSFILIRSSGDPARSIAGPEAPESAVDAIRTQLGLDRPLPVQFLEFVSQAAVGNLGTSLRYSVPNSELIGAAFLESLKLAIPAIVLSVVLGVSLGTIAAIVRKNWIDRIISILAMLTQAAPPFLIGLILILVFAVHFGVLPAGRNQHGFASVVLPAITMAMFPLGQIARITRTSLRDTLGLEFVTALRSRGLSDAAVQIRHALRNSLLPVLTVIGLMTGALISASVTIEYLFAWPGLGQLTVQAIEFRDLSLVQGIIIVGAALYVTINLAVDLLYPVLDPRTRVTK